ncbi:MAG: amino acid ABC transporter permease [Pseudomonadota bacterium]
MADTTAAGHAYVRSEMLPEKAPPVSEDGVIGWMKKNLFSNWFNTLLTFIALYILWIIFPPLIQFGIIDAVWSDPDGVKRAVCTNEEQGGLQPSGWFGACWPYVAANMKLFIYGRYPASELWRVDLTYFLFFATLIPLLIPSVPFKKLNGFLFLVAFPVAAFVLLAGGTEAGSASTYYTLAVLAALGLVLAFALAPSRDVSLRSSVARVGLAIVTALVVWAVLGLGTYSINELLALAGSGGTRNTWFGAIQWWLYPAIGAGIGIAAAFTTNSADTKGLAETLAPLFVVLAGICIAVAVLMLVTSIDYGLTHVETNVWGGLLVTLVIAVTGIVASLPLGVLLALGRRSKMPAVKLLSVVFIEFWRGVPLITVLFMSSVMLPLFLPAGTEFDKLLRALIGVALFTAAYMAEVIRGGIQALPKGQYEGAMALGLTYWQMMRMIILPQALTLVIPGIVNSFISLFKDTTLVLIIGLFDFLGQMQSTFTNPEWASPVQSLTGYLFAALIFWAFCFSMSRYSIFVERRLDTGHKS